MAVNSIVQPEIKKGGFGSKPNYKAGAKRSIQRLESLGFDPIKSLVENYQKLQEELVYHEKWRDGEIVPLTANGKVRSYNAETHMTIYDKLIKVGESLLRYGYGRVPENVDQSEKAPMPLIVNLTKKGEQYCVNEVQPDDDAFDIIEGDFYED
jgi:hypothetical protein